MAKPSTLEQCRNVWQRRETARETIRAALAEYITCDQWLHERLLDELLREQHTRKLYSA